MRFHLLGKDRQDQDRRLLAEDLALAAFSGSPESAVWLPPDQVEALLAVEPSANIAADAAREHLGRILTGFEALRPKLLEIAKARGKALLDAHKRVRKIAKGGARTTGIDPHEAVDVLGIFVFLPDGAAS